MNPSKNPDTKTIPAGGLTRRTFLGASGATALFSAAALKNVCSYAANGQVQLAVVGVGGRGTSLAKSFSELADCVVTMVCDVDPRRLRQAQAELPDPERVQAVMRHEEVMEHPEIDAVVIATADHWHTPLALHALNAGKHVYVEKPCGHNVYEGIALERAQAATGLCVQHGTQHRSGEGVMECIKYLQAGHLGKIRVAKAINHQFRAPIGRKPVQDPPEGVDYDRWLGPAPKVPFTENRWHYNWHWYWDYGCGDIGNDGVHQIDVARWGLGVGYPNKLDGPGGQLFYDDDHETPDTQMVTYQYDDCYLIYEMRLWTPYAMEGHDNGVVFYGDKGKAEVGRKGSFIYPVEGEAKRIGGSHDIMANLRNFVDCLKADNPAGLNAPAKEAAISSGLCHLGNIATRTGRALQFDREKLVCVGDEEATTMLRREYRAGYELPEVG